MAIRLSLLFLLAACAGARPAPQPALISGGDLVSDFALLRRAYEELHPGLYRYNTPAQLDASYARLTAAVEHGATLPQAYLALSRFLASIRCGHTYANFFNQPEPIARALFKTGATRLPFLFAWVDGRMIVTSESPLPRGTEVLAIDGVPVQQILRALLEVARGDGGNDRKRIDLLSLHGDADLETFDIFFPLLFPQRSAGDFELRIRPPGAAEKTLSLAALTYEQRAAAVPKKPAGWTLDVGEEAAWLRMPTWALYNGKWDWKQYLQLAFSSLAANGTRDLIIDLRGNEGGLDVGDVLLSHLIPRDLPAAPIDRLVRYRKAPADLLPILDTWDPSFKDWGSAAAGPDGRYYRLPAAGGGVIHPAAPRFAGRVFVIVSAANSSATFQFAQAVQREHLGTLVGTPTGGNQRGINGGAFFFVRLPRTGLEADLPLIGQYPPGDLPDGGLQPDVLVETTAADLAAGRDPVRAALEKL